MADGIYEIAIVDHSDGGGVRGVASPSRFGQPGCRGFPPSPIKHTASPEYLVLHRMGSIEASRDEVKGGDSLLRFLAKATALKALRFQLLTDALRDGVSAATILWRVGAVNPDGRRMAFPTFIERFPAEEG